MALTNNIQLLIGIYHQTYGNRVTLDNATQWAAWITERYRDYPNILWPLYPKATDAYKPLITKLADGIQKGDRANVSIAITSEIARTALRHLLRARCMPARLPKALPKHTPFWKLMLILGLSKQWARGILAML